MLRAFYYVLIACSKMDLGRLGRFYPFFMEISHTYTGKVYEKTRRNVPNVPSKKLRVQSGGTMSNKTVAVNERGLRIGEDHPNARYTDGEVAMVLGLRDEGLGYKRIAKAMDMPLRTVRDICNGARRCQNPTTWKRVRVSGDE